MTRILSAAETNIREVQAHGLDNAIRLRALVPVLPLIIRKLLILRRAPAALAAGTAGIGYSLGTDSRSTPVETRRGVSFSRCPKKCDRTAVTERL